MDTVKVKITMTEELLVMEIIKGSNFIKNRILGMDVLPDDIDLEDILTFYPNEVAQLRKAATLLDLNQRKTNIGLSLGSLLAIGSSVVTAGAMFVTCPAALAAVALYSGSVGAGTTFFSSICRSTSQNLIIENVKPIVSKFLAISRYMETFNMVRDSHVFNIYEYEDSWINKLGIEKLKKLKNMISNIKKFVAEMKNSRNVWPEMLCELCNSINDFTTAVTDAMKAFGIPPPNKLTSLLQFAKKSDFKVMPLITWAGLARAITQYRTSMETVLELFAKIGKDVVETGEQLTGIAKTGEDVVVACTALTQIAKNGVGKSFANLIHITKIEAAVGKASAKLTHITKTADDVVNTGTALTKITKIRDVGKAYAKLTHIAKTGDDVVTTGTGLIQISKVQTAVDILFPPKPFTEMSKVQTAVDMLFPPKPFTEMSKNGDEMFNLAKELTGMSKTGEDVVKTGKKLTKIAKTGKNAIKCAVLYKTVGAAFLMFGLYNDSVTLTEALSNMKEGSPTEMATFFRQIADTIENGYYRYKT